MNIIFTKKSLKYFSIGFFSLLVIMILQFISRYAEEIFDKGFSLGYIMKFIFHSSITLIGICLLFGILITTIFSYRFYSKNKLIAFRKEVVSGTFIVIGISILLFCFSNWIVPKSKLEIYSTLYEMKMTVPGEAVKSVNRNKFTDNHGMLPLKEINLKVDTLNTSIETYKRLCDSILGLLPDSIFYEKIERLNIENYGLIYKSNKNGKLVGREAKRATYRLQNSLRSLKMTISQKKKFTKEISTRIALPITLVLLFIIGASFGYLYNDQKSFLLVILALFTTTFFLKSEMLITASLFNNGVNTSFSIITLITVTMIFLIKGLRKKQEITQPNKS